jgi:hypothetical protein
LVTAKVYIDCSYEGDLVAKSGVSHTWGRESREQYGESLAGVRPNIWVYDIDPYKEPGNPKSGLIPFVKNRKLGSEGSADKLTMGYCFRYKFDRKGEGIAIPKPIDYDPAEFELYRRAFHDEVDIFSTRSMRKLGRVTTAKRGGGRLIGTNLNRSLMTHTIYGCNAYYPDGDWATRARIWKFHQGFLVTFMHFLKTDPVVPKTLKERARKLSFKLGDFDETKGWPHQL